METPDFQYCVCVSKDPRSLAFSCFQIKVGAAVPTLDKQAAEVQGEALASLSLHMAMTAPESRAPALLDPNLKHPFLFFQWGNSNPGNLDTLIHSPACALEGRGKFPIPGTRVLSHYPPPNCAVFIQTIFYF